MTDSACDVWIVRLAPVPGAEALLDAEEAGRAARFRRPADRHRFVGAHAALRAVLGPYARRPPGALAFAREACPLCGEPHGRPRLAGGEPVAWHFSLSHTDGVAAVAVARRPVGVDVEAVSRAVTVDDLAAALHPDERRALAALPEPDRRPAALRCWVRKEAYLKGIGTGLGVDPSTVAVGLGTPGDPPGPGTATGSERSTVAGGGWGGDADAGGPGAWTVADVRAGPGHLAAVALSGPPDTAGPPAVHHVGLAELLDGFPRASAGTLPPEEVTT